MDTDPVFESGRPRRPGKPSRIVGRLSPCNCGVSSRPLWAPQTPKETDLPPFPRPERNYKLPFALGVGCDANMTPKMNEP